VARPIKKGQVLNPTGIKEPQEVRRARKLNQHDFTLTATNLINKSQEWLEDFLQDKTKPSGDLLIAKMILMGLKQGNVKTASFVYDRVLGKPKEMLVLKDERAPVKIDEASLKDRLLSQLTDEQLQALIDKPKQDIEEVEYKEVTNGNDPEPA
jgi:hypothetical protein